MWEWRRCFRKPFCVVFSSERKKPLTHCRISKYDSGQEIRIGNPESIDVSEVKLPKFSAGKRGTDLGRDGGEGGIIQRRPPSRAWLRKV